MCIRDRLWAGFSRVIAQQAGNTRLGNLNPIIYQLANQQYATAGFHDVTIGNNGYNGLPGFSAGPGYDQTTGWGTIDFNAVSYTHLDVYKRQLRACDQTAGALGVPAGKVVGAEVSRIDPRTQLLGNVVHGFRADQVIDDGGAILRECGGHFIGR